MKTYIFLFLASIFLVSCGTPASVKNFYRQHKRGEEVTKMNIPGWLIWLGTGIANEIVKEEEVKLGLSLAKKVRNLRFLTDESGGQVSPEHVSRLVSNVKKHSYEDLIYVREEAMTVNFMIRGKEDKIKNLLILVNDDNELVMVSMKTNLTIKDLSQVINSFQDDIKKKMKKEEKNPPPKEEKKKIPQA